MGFAWLKQYMPRTLYGRAAAILFVPIFIVQFLVSYGFIQRYYDGVTVRLTEGVILDAAEVHRRINAADTQEDAQQEAKELAEPLGLTVRFGGEAVVEARPAFTDVSGSAIVRTLRAELPALTQVSLDEVERSVRFGMTSTWGPLVFEVPRRRFIASNPHQLLVIILFFTVLMSCIAYLFLRNQLRPITRLAAAAEAFGKGESVSYKPGGAVEVRAAGAAFLDMRRRIEMAIEQRTLMLSGVSHDLRTPLTRLKLSLSMLDDTPEIEALRRDVEDMEHLIADFLAFARGDAMEDAKRADAVALAREVVAKAKRGGGAVHFEGASDPAAVVRMKPVAVERALGNLVGNALRYGGMAAVSVSQSDGHVDLIVEDDGPGIPAEDREAATRAFTRLDSARNQDKGTGVGLGLAIARDVARGHGGQLTLGQSERFGGLRAVLSLPE